MKFQFNKTFFLISILTLIVGIVLFFVSTGFVRNYVGDVVVVIFLYSLLSSFFKIRVSTKVIIILSLGIVIELTQLIFILPDDSLSSLTLGGYFDPFDILAYIIGLTLITLTEIKK